MGSYEKADEYGEELFRGVDESELLLECNDTGPSGVGGAAFTPLMPSRLAERSGYRAAQHSQHCNITGRANALDYKDYGEYGHAAPMGWPTMR